jgi:hypothetical protein
LKSSCTRWTIEFCGPPAADAEEGAAWEGDMECMLYSVPAGEAGDAQVGEGGFVKPNGLGRLLLLL